MRLKFLLDENSQGMGLLTLGFDRRPKKLNRLLLCFYWIFKSQPLGGKDEIRFYSRQPIVFRKEVL